MENINQEFAKRQERIPVRVGRVGLHCETRTENGKTVDLGWEPKYDVAVLIAKAAGYADVVPDGEGFWKVNLTDQGRAFVDAYHIAPEAPPASSHCGYQIRSLPLATAHVTEVTGIVPNERTAQVELLWNWAVTDLAKGLKSDGTIYAALDDVQRDSLKGWLFSNPGPRLPIPVPADEELKAPHHDTALFLKYDDGWRVHSAE